MNGMDSNQEHELGYDHIRKVLASERPAPVTPVEAYEIVSLLAGDTDENPPTVEEAASDPRTLEAVRLFWRNYASTAPGRMGRAAHAVLVQAARFEAADEDRKNHEAQQDADTRMELRADTQ